MRQDVLVWCLSLVYIGAIMGGMFGWGSAAGWSAEKPIESPDPWRFWPKPDRNCTEVEDPFADEAPIRGVTKDCYSRWYYWQLPESNVCFDEATGEATGECPEGMKTADGTTRAVVWILYSVHQIAHWALMWMAQQDRIKMVERKEQIYSTKLRWYNWALIGVTYLFHLLHLVQTHTTYDATAKDVIIQSSQASVIMMLVFVICLEYKNRGMICGWPNASSDDWFANRLKLSELPFHYVRKYHGYAFAWASIFTFWYHPMENTYGHMFGFIHTFMLMIQGSLVYQKMHLNRYWRLVLESWVWFHGFSVAVMVTTKDPWWTDMAPFMFGYGFGTLFFLTQLYILPFWSRINPWFRIIPAICWLIFAIVIVLAVEVIPNNFLMGLMMIPLGQWGCAVAAWLILFVFTKCMPNILSSMHPALQISMSAIIYTLFIVLSFLFQKYGDKVDIAFMAGTYIFVFINIIGCCISWFCLPKPHHFVETDQIKTDESKSEIKKNQVESRDSQSSQL